MTKKVYLYELDSVRNSQEEIRIGQQALFEELVKNGNIVVLSFNQLADSQAFLSAVRNEETYEEIMELFRIGALKISLFSDIRTASQYMQMSLEKCLSDGENSYRFSGIPVEEIDKTLLQDLMDALHFSDPEHLMERSVQAEKEEEKERLEYLYRYIKMILMLSEEKLASNQAKRESGMSFTDFRRKLEQIYREQPVLNYIKGSYRAELEELLPRAFDTIDEKEALIIQWGREAAVREREKDPKVTEKGMIQNYINDRSNWYKAFDRDPGNQDLYLAVALVDFCYNYTVEDSISEISRHYQWEEADMEFQKDFEQRLYQYWAQFQQKVHRFHEKDRTDCLRYEKEFPDWKLAVRIICSSLETRGRIKRVREFFSSDLSQLEESGEETAGIPVYEKGIEKQRKDWLFLVAGSLVIRGLIALLYVGLFCAIEAFLNWVQDKLDEKGILKQVVEPTIFMILNVVIFSLLSSEIAEKLKLHDILESMRDIKNSFFDLIRFLHLPGGAAYIRMEEGEQ